MKYFLLMLGMVVAIGGFPQNHYTPKQYLSELKVGDPMPDIPLGAVINNMTGKRLFSEFRGKLVILDFWITTCTTCIEGFPKMSKLQKEFGDKIQIFLVNPWETEEQIKARFDHSLLKTYGLPNNIPCIVNARDIYKLFPGRDEIGYHVWIDSSGIVRLRGISLNTNEVKIRQMLEGKDVGFIKDGGSLAKNKPLYSIIQNTNVSLQYNSLFTSFNDDFGSPWGGGSVINKEDSVSQTMRNSLINVTVAGLFSYAAKEMLKDNNVIKGNRVFLSVSNPLLYTTDSVSVLEHTDQTWKMSRYCYEQITPLGLSDSVRKRYMFDDMNRYFGNLLGVVGKIEERKMSCFRLVSTSKVNKIQSKGGDQQIAFETIDGKRFIRYINYSVNDVMQSISNNVLQSSDILMNESVCNGKIDILIPGPENIKNMRDLKDALKPYDLDVVQGERIVKLLVIKEK